MSLQDWGAIGELVGGFAIIVSLLYVGVQVRLSTKATKAATNQAFSRQYTDILMRISLPESSEVFRKGLQGLDRLDGRESVSFFTLMSSILRTYETFYHEQKDGRFDSPMYDSWIVQLNEVVGNRGVREYWEFRRHHYSPAFAEYIEEMIRNSEPRSMYPGPGDR